MNLKECKGTTLSSWSAVRRSMAGYCVSPGGTVMLCSGEYLAQHVHVHVRHHVMLWYPCTYVMLWYSISM